jgi:hypothetical protein
LSAKDQKPEFDTEGRAAGFEMFLKDSNEPKNNDGLELR